MILLMVPFGKYLEGAIIERGEALEAKLIADKKAVKVERKRDSVERAVIRPKEIR